MHRIRLSGFWAVTALDGGRVRHARRFGRPRLLDATESAWLVGDRAPGTGFVLLNGKPVGGVSGGQPFAFEVTDLLQPRNEVWIDAVEGDLGEAWLEIRGEPGA